jgi:hypothetical protein
VSLLLLWHLTAIFMAALSVPRTSDLASDVAQRTFMQKYLDALHLNQGHAFFAPDPPAGMLVQYEILDERGRVIQRSEFPNSKEQWPRLLYHRHFMLADQIAMPARNEQEEKAWTEKYLTYFARHLLRKSDGASIRMQRVLHEPLPRDEILKGRKLNDPSTYRVLVEVSQTRRDLAAADAAPTSRNAAGWTSGGPR